MKHLDGTGIIVAETIPDRAKIYFVGSNIACMSPVPNKGMRISLCGCEYPIDVFCTEEEFQKLIESFAF